MCGIAGYYGSEENFNPDLLAKMSRCQSHRGPDGTGEFVDGPVGLVHQRLAILGRTHGDQPMTTPDGRFTIIYNGEVYNYKQLQAELEELGHEFHTETDTEVVLKGFAQWGSAIFDRLNGMWGLAVWDSEKAELTLSRDHFGIKPVYFAKIGEGVVFGSELKSILAVPQFKAEANERILYRYLRFRIHEDSRETFFKGIERLLPGEMAVINTGGVTVTSYTNFVEELREAAKIQRPYDESAVSEYRELLFKSVKERLQSEVPVGTSLSGGLDSSAVAVIINRLLGTNKEETASVGQEQNLFSAVFPGSLNDEERYVDAVLERCDNGVNAHKILPNADQFKADLVDFIRTQEEPIISSGPYAQYCVMKEATKHVTVLLDGQGADEMMAGYIPYYFTYFNQLRQQGEYRKLAFEVARSADVLARLVRFRAKNKLTAKPDVPVETLLNADFVASYPQERLHSTRNNLRERLIEDLFKNSLPSLLRYEDRNTMRFSLEGRVPFLDKDTVKFLFSLADDAIIKAGWNKRILRDATKDILPEMVSTRRNKIGFTTPENEWFKRIKNSINAIFESESFGNRPWFNQAAVLKAFHGYINEENGADTMLFWRLLNVEIWARLYLDENPDFDIFSAESVDKSDMGASLPADFKEPLEANDGKELDLKLGDVIARRYPLQTEKFSKETQMDEEISRYVLDFFKELEANGDADDKHATEGRRWNLTISEKIIAIMQGRSWFTWEIKPGFAARKLSKYVSRTPAGIGLGDPVTMQLAINEAGLPRIIFASAGGFVGKLAGKRGVFYNLAGANVRAIDGPTEYSVYPSNVSAKLPPKDPEKVAAHLKQVLLAVLPENWAKTFDGVVIMDANDIGRNALGAAGSQSLEHYEAQFADNPLGQGTQQTPMAVVFERPVN